MRRTRTATPIVAPVVIPPPDDYLVFLRPEHVGPYFEYRVDDSFVAYDAEGRLLRFSKDVGGLVPAESVPTHQWELRRALVLILSEREESGHRLARGLALRDLPLDEVIAAARPYAVDATWRIRPPLGDRLFRWLDDMGLRVRRWRSRSGREQS